MVDAVIIAMNVPQASCTIERNDTKVQDRGVKESTRKDKRRRVLMPSESYGVNKCLSSVDILLETIYRYCCCTEQLY